MKNISLSILISAFLVFTSTTECGEVWHKLWQDIKETVQRLTKKGEQVDTPQMYKAKTQRGSVTKRAVDGTVNLN